MSKSLFVVALGACSIAVAIAQSPTVNRSDQNTSADERSRSQVSPARRIERRANRDLDAASPTDIRSIDGQNNNIDVPEMGAAHTQLRRAVESDYDDGISAPAGALRPSPRAISNAVASQVEDRTNAASASDYLWQWGQFLDHDIDLTDGVDPAEPLPIQVPVGDPFFDPDGDGNEVIDFNRSIYDPSSGVDGPRQQLNEISAWIDASNVYGSDTERAAALRTLDGTGRLKTSDGDLLPFNVDGLPNAGGPSDSLFLAGDVRANEQVGLTAMHTLFVREHNRYAERLIQRDPDLTGEQVYQRARTWVGALMQRITYNEFLPLLLGRGALGAYQGYDSQAQASIANTFSTASFRFGHSALSSNLLRLDESGEATSEGHLPLRSAFFAPQRILDEGGIDPILRGLAAQPCQEIDVFVIDEVRNFLFGQPGAGGFDLAALNIQRGRDHGLPSYNDTREALGLPRKVSIEDVSSDPEVRARLESIYDSVDDIDTWVGGLAEDRLAGAMVGELIHRVLSDQFRALRDGDRFWYEQTLSDAEVRRVNRTRLSDVIRRNTEIGDELPADVFRVADRDGGRRGGRPARGR